MRDPFGRHGSGPRSSPSGCATMCFRRCRPRLRQGPARPPLRVTRPSHAGSGRVPWYVGKAPRSRSSTMLSEAGPLDELSAFAAIERGTVGRNRDENVVLTELQTFGGLDRGDKVGDAGETQLLEPRDCLGIDLLAARQIG